MTYSQHLTIPIDGMSCGSCIGRIEKALSGIEGIENVSVNFAGESAQLDISDGSNLAAVAAELGRIGYSLRTQSVTLIIPSMSCASCVGRLNAELATVSGVLDVNVNLATESATVRYVEGVTGPDDLIAVTRAAGYPADVADEGKTAGVPGRNEEKTRHIARKTVVAAALALPIFLIEMGSHVLPSIQNLIVESIGQQANWYIQFALTTIILAGPGRVFYIKGFPALLRGVPDMNSLVAIGHGSGMALFGRGDFYAWPNARCRSRGLFRGGSGYRRSDPSRTLYGGPGQGPNRGGD